MSKRSSRRPPARSSAGIPTPVLLLGGLAFLAVAAVLVFTALNLGRPPATPGNGTGPRLAVDQERIDLGKRPLNIPVHAEFKVTNKGDQVLTLDTSAPVRAVEGC